MKGSCHCGAVQVSIARAPDYLNRCNCSLCTKLGALWGYFTPREVTVSGRPRTYLRADVEVPSLAFSFCGDCGATVQWTSLEPDPDQTAINMRLFEPEELAGIEVRYGNRRDFPDGERRYYRPPTTFERAVPAA